MCAFKDRIPAFMVGGGTCLCLKMVQSSKFEVQMEAATTAGINWPTGSHSRTKTAGDSVSVNASKASQQVVEYQNRRWASYESVVALIEKEYENGRQLPTERIVPIKVKPSSKGGFARADCVGVAIVGRSANADVAAADDGDNLGCDVYFKGVHISTDKSKVKLRPNLMRLFGNTTQWFVDNVYVLGGRKVRTLFWVFDAYLFSQLTKCQFVGM